MDMKKRWTKAKVRNSKSKPVASKSRSSLP